MTVGGTASGPSPAPGRRKATKPRPDSVTARGALGAPRVPTPSFQSKRWRIGLGVLAALALVAWFVWYASTPEELPTDDRTMSANGVVGVPIYVGMFSAPDDFGRTLRIAGVRVKATANADIKITPLLCRRGTVGVTTRPDGFCAELVNPENQRMIGGDSIVLKVETDASAVAVIDQLRVAFREDVRWDTQPAGHQQAIVTMAGRPEATGTEGR